MNDSQYGRIVRDIEDLKILLVLLVFSIALVILAIGLTHSGPVAWFVDGSAILLLLVLWFVKAYVV
jgi:hypothetical protein